MENKIINLLFTEVDSNDNFLLDTNENNLDENSKHMKYNYIITAINFSAFSNPFICMVNPIQYLELELDHPITRKDYLDLITEQYEENKLSLLSITKVIKTEEETTNGK